jgi:hypothetical protein
MKGQYVGDIGDFGKVLLLKHLVGQRIKIGINWVLTKNDDSEDGRHRNYFMDQGANCLCNCDPGLLERIAPLAAKPKSKRVIGDLEELVRVFSKDTKFYSEYFAGDSSRIDRDNDAFDLLNPMVCDLVFFDPDNGIGGERGKSAKHVYLSDLRRYWERGQSLLIYHHLPMYGSASDAITATKIQLLSLLNAKVNAYHFRTGTGRVYFLCLKPAHSSRVPDPLQVQAFAPLLVSKSEWAKRGRIMGKFCSEDHPWYRLAQ